MEALGIDIKLLLAQGVNFLLFAIIFKKFLYAPFKKYLQKQMGEEEEKTRILADLQIREESLGEREKEVLAQAREQALKIIKEAEKTAEAKKAEIAKEAEEEAQLIKKKAEQDIERERKKLMDDVRTSVIKTSEAMTETVLKDFIDQKQQKALLEQIFKKLKASKVYEN